MSTFGERLKEARKSAKISRKALADKLDLTQQSVYFWETDVNVPKSQKMDAIATALGVPLQWLVYGLGEPSSFKTDDGTISIPLLDVNVSAGGGGFNDSNKSVVRLIDLSLDWANKNLSPSQRKCLRVFSISGDSMFPTLEDEDLVLVDSSCTKISGDGLYIVNYDGMVFSKRVQQIGREKLLLISDNSAYKSIEVDISEETQIQFDVLGKIVFSWHGSKR